MKICNWKTLSFMAVYGFSPAVFANSACDADASLTIVSATDDGLYDEAYSPDKTIDGSFDPESRWSSESQGSPKTLLIDLGAPQSLKSLNIAWYKGDSRKSSYTIQASVDGEEFQEFRASGQNAGDTLQSAGDTLEFESHKFENVRAQFVRIVGHGNDSNEWNSIVEVSASGCGEPVEAPDSPILTEREGRGLFGLDVEKSPGENFDLSGWYITTPADDDGDEKADSVYENELTEGWTDPRYFYTDPATGGMVFRSTPAGAKTSENTSYTRTELRGMLRGGDYSIQPRAEDDSPNLNNWVFSSAPASAQAKAAGVDGLMEATLSVNQVTRLGKEHQIGRVIIGQIHAKDDEPIRLYYRKLPKNKYGSIYYAHEPADGKEQWVELIGSRADSASNPVDGIALDETFSYEIEVKGQTEGQGADQQIIPMLHVKIIRDDGREITAQPFDMRDSGFNVEDDFMFFKAGAYSQNNSSPEPETDFDKVTFYKLSSSHKPAPEGGPSVAEQGVIFNDSFADGGRDDGPDESDTSWWYTTNSSALEIAANTLGLVSGGSGRGLRTTFPEQALEEGQTLQATFTFTTPETIGVDRESAFRIGLFNKLGRPEMETDQSASSKDPNKNYDGLPGYMIDFDINLSDAAEANIDIRKHNEDSLGRLLGTTKSYQHLGGGGDAYQFEPEQTYTGVMAIKKVNNGIELTGSLSQDGNILSNFSLVDEGSDVNNIGMLAFHVNSKTFGSSKERDQPDNGLDFSNISVEVLP